MNPYTIANVMGRGLPAAIKPCNHACSAKSPQQQHQSQPAASQQLQNQASSKYVIFHGENHRKFLSSIQQRASFMFFFMGNFIEKF